MRKTIDTAPRNGEFVILEDAARGAFAFVRWSHDAAQWLDEKGTPCHLTATHWHSLQNPMRRARRLNSTQHIGLR